MPLNGSLLTHEAVVARCTRNLLLSLALRVFLAAPMFAIPVMYLVWQSRGLDDLAIAKLASVFAVGVIICEIPSGLLADRIGRRGAMLLGAIVMLIGNTYYLLASSLSGFLTADLLSAIGFALISGTDQALLYESLQGLGRGSEYTKWWGRARTIDLVTAAGAATLGGFLAEKDLAWPLVACVSFTVVQCVLSCMLTEVPRTTPTQAGAEESPPAWRSLFRNPRLVLVMLFTGALASFAGVCNIFGQAYYKAVDLEPSYFGMIAGVGSLFAALVAHFAYRIDKAVGPRYSLALPVLALGTLFVALGLITAKAAVGLMLLSFFTQGYAWVILGGKLNQTAGPGIRATAHSVSNMIGRLFSAGLMPLVGWALVTYGLSQTFICVGIAGILVLGLMLRFRPADV